LLQATEQVNSQIGPLAARFGAVLGIGRDDLRWALAMVQSRRVAIDGEVWRAGEDWGAEGLQQPLGGIRAAPGASLLWGKGRE
jgi:hypothetical protein